MHIASHCPKRRLKCSLGCGAELDADELEKHQASACPRRRERCKGCGKEVQASDMEKHVSTECPVRTVACPRTCGVDVPEAKLKEHLASECQRRVLLCPLGCGQEGECRMLNLHMEKYCPKRPAVTGKAAPPAAAAAAAGAAVAAAGAKSPPGGPPPASAPTGPPPAKGPPAKEPPLAAQPKGGPAPVQQQGSALAKLTAKAPMQAAPAQSPPAAQVATVGAPPFHGGAAAPPVAAGLPPPALAGAAFFPGPGGSLPGLPGPCLLGLQGSPPPLSMAGLAGLGLPVPLGTGALTTMPPLLPLQPGPGAPLMLTIPPPAPLLFGQAAAALQPQGGGIAANDLLLKIRQGVASQDKESVRAAIRAAEEANVQLDAHVRNMIAQWLQEAPASAAGGTGGAAPQEPLGALALPMPVVPGAVGATFPGAAPLGALPLLPPGDMLPLPPATVLPPLGVMPPLLPPGEEDVPPPPPPDEAQGESSSVPESALLQVTPPVPKILPNGLPEKLPSRGMPVQAKSGSAAINLVTVWEAPPKAKGPVLPAGEAPVAGAVVFSAPVLKKAEPESKSKSNGKAGPADMDMDDLFSSFLNEVEAPGAAAKDGARAEDPAKLVAQLKSKDWQARFDALEALAKLGAAAAPHVAAMAACIVDRDNAVRNAARKALETVKAAAEAEGEREEEARRAAKRARLTAEEPAEAGGSPAAGEDGEEAEAEPEDKRARILAMRRQQRKKEQEKQENSSDEESGTEDSPRKRPRAAPEPSRAAPAPPSPRSRAAAPKAAAPKAAAAAPAPLPVGPIETKAQEKERADEKPQKEAKEAWEYMKPDSFGSGQFFSFDKF